jgi:SWI5-dependent HO expression protein 3
MDSPKRKQNTSQVIDSLHSTIDELKSELNLVTLSCNDYRKKYELMSKRNDSIVDQLANVKHEADMVNALLKRKERRILDLENQLNELSSNNETLQLNNKNLKIRCENLNESSASSIAEFERLKISYDALISSQKEYKKHYQQELFNITSKFEQFKSESINKWESLFTKLTNDDKDFDTLLESLTNKRKTMDNIYVNKNRVILDLLAKLAKLTKIHGQETKSILQNNTNILSELLVKFPDLLEKLKNIEKVDLDLEQLINDSQEALSTYSVDEEVTSMKPIDVEKDKDLKGNAEPKESLSRSNTLQSKRKKNKRNSLRFDSKSGPDFSNINTPTINSIVLPKRANINKLLNSTRIPTSPTEHERQTSNFGNHIKQTTKITHNHQNTNGSNYNHNSNLVNHNNNYNSRNVSQNSNNSGSSNNSNHTSSTLYNISGYNSTSISHGYNNNNSNQNLNQNQNQKQNQSQPAGISNNANNFNKFDHLSNNYKQHRNSSYNSISQNNQNQQNQQTKQAKRKSYSGYNSSNSNNNNNNNNSNSNNINNNNSNNGINHHYMNKRNSQILDKATN